MLRFATFSILAFLSTVSALQLPLTFECRFCRELSRSVLPRVQLFHAGDPPANIPEALWKAVRGSLPSLASDPFCYGSCFRREAETSLVVHELLDKTNVSCSLCQQLMTVGKNFVSGTEENFENKLNVTCEHLDFLAPLCLMIVEEHGKELYAMEKSNIAPLPACTQIKLC